MVVARKRRPRATKSNIGEAPLKAQSHASCLAAAMFALQHEVLAAQGIPIQGVGRQAYRS